MEHSNTIQLKDLPSPKGDFLVGHFLRFKEGNEHEVIEKWIEEHGDLIKLNFMGKPFLITANEAINRQINYMRPGNFTRLSMLNDIIEEAGINGVFNAEGTEWKRHRKPVADSMNLKRVKETFPIIQEKTHEMIKKFDHFIEQDKDVNIKSEFRSYAVDVLSESVFGYKLDRINDETYGFQHHIQTVLKGVSNRVVSIFPIWRFFKRKEDKEFDNAVKETTKEIYKMIDAGIKRMKASPEKRENPSDLVEKMLADKENAYTKEEISGNIFTLIMAGEETTANSLAWTIYYLCLHPEAIDKVRKEAISVYGDEVIPEDKQQLFELKYTNAVLQEALRLRSTITHMHLEATEDTQVENLMIPKGTGILIQARKIHLQDAFFSDAEKFAPERWMASECPMFQNHNTKAATYFGIGPRICPGKKLALDEMIMIISVMCKNYEINLVTKNEDIKEQYLFTMSPVEFLIKLKKVL